MEAGLTVLTSSQRAVLKRGNIHDISDIMLRSNQEIARKCKTSAAEAQEIIDALYRQAPIPELRRLEDVKHIGSDTFTTGDSILDSALGGGIRPGMVWEVVGESAAGKTQFALQLSLFVQLPLEQKGLLGSTCYITTSSTLPTSRLVEIMKANPLLPEAECDLKNVHTLATPTIPHLILVLSERLTAFIDTQANRTGLKPVKLLVIDALAELFHTSDKTTTNTLVERSKNIAHISFLLHNIAKKYNIAVLVLNEVVDVFDRAGQASDEEHSLLYSEQSRWFGRGHSIPGESKKEASLGIIWANQVNARIMLSRTGRRRYLDDAENPSSKRLKIQEISIPPAAAQASDDLALIRRLSVIFSSVSRPVSLDYIVTKAGISVLSDGISNSSVEDDQRTSLAPPISVANSQGEVVLLPPLDVGTIEARSSPGDLIRSNNEEQEHTEDEWDGYWAQNTITQVELDAIDDSTS